MHPGHPNATDYIMIGCRSQQKLPAEVLVGGLLVGGHEVHELQAGPLVRSAQEGTAVAVDPPHPLQRHKERLPYLVPLRSQTTLLSTH